MSSAAQHQTKKVQSKEPSIELVGASWRVTNQTNNKEIVINANSPRLSVDIINCTGCLIRVVGKVNTINVQQSSKSQILFENAISSIEIVHSNKLGNRCHQSPETKSLVNTFCGQKQISRLRVQFQQ